ncbi:hypothetical protein A3K93_03015 [Acinetobacter sp. NCu2D-2]|nr:hypothetical protein A3K93_03015 [Acinetobacter sp. NCu2D-2]
MTPDLLLTIIQTAIGIFTISIIILLIHPRSRSYLFSMHHKETKDHKGSQLLHIGEMIAYPIIWLLKIIATILK